MRGCIQLKILVHPRILQQFSYILSQFYTISVIFALFLTKQDIGLRINNSNERFNLSDIIQSISLGITLDYDSEKLSHVTTFRNQL